METLCIIDKVFLWHTKVLENTPIYLVNITFNDEQALKTRINAHSEDIEMLYKNKQIIFIVTNDKIFKMTITLNN